MSPAICPLCSSTKQHKKIQINKKNKVLTCNNCSLSFLNPIPSREKISALYRREYFQETSSSGYSNYSSMENVLKNESLRKLNYIKKYTNKKKLMDVGSGLGTFLKVAKNAGYKVSGNDISTFAAERIKKQLKIPFYLGSLEKEIFPQSKFEIITAWDVIEHIFSVNKAIKNIKNALKSGGLLFFTTPNINSWDACLMGKHWYGYKKVPEHVLFFSPESITNALENSGFNVLEIKTWGFERDLSFISEKLSIYNGHIYKVFDFLIKFLKIENKSVYLPLTDMMIVARKIDEN